MSSTGLTLLVIDDDDAGRRMLKRALERKGHTVHEASAGREGLELIRSLKPTIAFLDLRMPGELSGFDVARELSGDETVSGVQVVVVSASVHVDARTLADDIGVAGFVEKPVDFDVLYRTIDDLLAE